MTYVEWQGSNWILFLILKAIIYNVDIICFHFLCFLLKNDSSCPTTCLLGGFIIISIGYIHDCNFICSIHHQVASSSIYISKNLSIIKLVYTLIKTKKIFQKMFPLTLRIYLPIIFFNLSFVHSQCDKNSSSPINTTCETCLKNYTSN